MATHSRQHALAGFKNPTRNMDCFAHITATEGNRVGLHSLS
jgi:hypothetical protein